ncbi:DUF833-domain-containing protein [Exidia glandulosa HHB12029]|uniref:DUF833-domain-containing protein n=1 Tax=Exidia glandulosa HHB12029 TaxID=1314781 RepID=A0A165DCB0_EXIGL|nr:DUF833-domain-containing protein [Exidia glandulosa HHB12029]
MCIVLLSTAHPDYPLVLIDNRDEFVARPTSRVEWWGPENSPDGPAYILSARDLLRPEHGTWMGITRHGRFAVLTNYREEDTHDAEHPVVGTRSRGSMVKNWLQLPPESPETVEAFIARLLSEDGGVGNVGGFSLICGQARRAGKDSDASRIEPLALISNRAVDVSHTVWLGEHTDETHGLSNTAFDQPWPKVLRGKELLADAINNSMSTHESKDDFIRRLFAILDAESLPTRAAGESFEHYLDNLQHSIFIPPIGGRADYEEYMRSIMQPTPVTEHPPEVKVSEPDMLGVYGTQRQTVLLVDKHGHVTYVERRLYDEKGRDVPRGRGDETVEFDIEGW